MNIVDRFSEPAYSHHRVLIIEDNPDLMLLIEDLVAMMGYDTQAAPDARKGIELAMRYQPSVIICDIGLPDMPGYEVARAIRSDARLRHTYLVAMTGYGQPEHTERAMDAGFDQHMVKPVDHVMLGRMLSEATRMVECHQTDCPVT